jgi:DNA-binding NarL/FixJ family response regulator
VDSEQQIRIISVDDHDVVRKGIAAILSTEPQFQLLAEGSTAASALRLYREWRPDVVLMDLRLLDGDGIDVTRQLRAEFPAARVIVLTSYDGDQDIYRALEAGVRGYLLKEMVYTEMIRAIRIVHGGKRFIPFEVSQQLSGFFPEVALTRREVEVLGLVARGCGNKEVGDVLGTAPGTVKMHVQSILSKLGAKDRTHAVTIGLRRGIIHLHSPDLASSIPNG